MTLKKICHFYSMGFAPADYDEVEARRASVLPGREVASKLKKCAPLLYESCGQLHVVTLLIPPHFGWMLPNAKSGFNSTQTHHQGEASESWIRML
jgi:hypothetical protein